MEDDAVGRMFAEAGRAFPELMSPLVHERDLYLAWSLKRSKAVNGTKTVVGVVGKGHLRGVVYALTADNGRLRFADLVDGKNNRSGAPARLARRLAFDALIGAGLYLAWLGLQAALPA